MYTEYIEINPKVLTGKPVIKGTRIAVDLILEKLGNGKTFEEILNMYPHITIEQINACLRFASKYINDEEIIII